MFLSMNWISDFVDLTGLDKTKLISQFSLSAAEVENEIFYKGSDISGIVVAGVFDMRYLLVSLYENLRNRISARVCSCKIIPVSYWYEFIFT